MKNTVKSENHQNQHAYLQCIYRNIQQSKVLKNVEGVIKYLNAVPGMYHSMDSIASLYDIEIDKCLENWRKINISPYLLLFTKQLTMRWRSAYRHKVKKKSIHFESFKEHKNWWHITHSAQKLVTKTTKRLTMPAPRAQTLMTNITLYTAEPTTAPNPMSS